MPGNPDWWWPWCAKNWKIKVVQFMVEWTQSWSNSSKYPKQETPRRKLHFTKIQSWGIFRSLPVEDIAVQPRQRGIVRCSWEVHFSSAFLTVFFLPFLFLALPPLCALLCSGLNSSVHFVELLWCLNEIINEREGLYIVSKYLLLGNEDDFLIKKS